MPGWPTVDRTDDHALVDALRRAEPGGPAKLYDAYAERLHDYACSLTGDRDTAADAVHDAIVTAQARLERLKDRGRLRAWLYALTRFQAVARLGRGDDDGLPPPVLDDPDDPELAELVHQALGELSRNEREVLELSIRHGLTPVEVGGVLGLTSRQAATRLGRARDHVENAAAAVLLARNGRAHCPDLSAMVDSWEGPLTPLLRRRLAGHIGGCEVCTEGRHRQVSAARLLDMVPVTFPPISLRRRVIDICGDPSMASARSMIVDRGDSFDRAGFPVAPKRRGRRATRPAARTDTPDRPRRGTPDDLARRGAAEEVSRHGVADDLTLRGAAEDVAWPGAAQDTALRGAADDLTRWGATEDVASRAADDVVRGVHAEEVAGRGERAWTHAAPPVRDDIAWPRAIPPVRDDADWPRTDPPARTETEWGQDTAAWSPAQDTGAWAQGGAPQVEEENVWTKGLPPLREGGAWPQAAPVREEAWSRTGAQDSLAWPADQPLPAPTRAPDEQDAHGVGADPGGDVAVEEGTVAPGEGGPPMPETGMLMSRVGAHEQDDEDEVASWARSVRGGDDEPWPPAEDDAPETTRLGRQPYEDWLEEDTGGAHGRRRRRRRLAPVVLAGVAVLAATGAVIVLNRGGGEAPATALHLAPTTPSAVASATEPELETAIEPSGDPTDTERPAVPTTTPPTQGRSAPTATTTRPAAPAPTATRRRPAPGAKLAVSCPGTVDAAGKIGLSARNANVTWTATASNGLGVFPAAGTIKAGESVQIWVTVNDPSEGGSGTVSLGSNGGAGSCAVSWNGSQPQAPEPPSDDPDTPTPTASETPSQSTEQTELLEK